LLVKSFLLTSSLPFSILELEALFLYEDVALKALKQYFSGSGQS